MEIVMTARLQRVWESFRIALSSWRRLRTLKPRGDYRVLRPQIIPFAEQAFVVGSYLLFDSTYLISLCASDALSSEALDRHSKAY